MNYFNYFNGQRGEMQHSEMQHSEMQHSEMQHGEMQHGEMQHGEMQHGEMQHGEMQHGEMQHDEGQRGEGQMERGMAGGMGMGTLSSDRSLINDISEAVIREAHAFHFYQRLAELAPNDEYMETILRIQRDEERHYHWFTMILRRMGAQQPQIPPGNLPTDFIGGVRTAIRHELDDAAFYQDISYRATSHPVQMHFMHASHDEQRHASWFQYMLMNL